MRVYGERTSFRLDVCHVGAWKGEAGGVTSTPFWQFAVFVVYQVPRNNAICSQAKSVGGASDADRPVGCVTSSFFHSGVRGFDSDSACSAPPLLGMAWRVTGNGRRRVTGLAAFCQDPEICCYSPRGFRGHDKHHSIHYCSHCGTGRYRHVRKYLHSSLNAILARA